MLSRPVPQTSIGRLVSLSVDNPIYYTHSPASAGLSSSSPQTPPPPLIPISSMTASTATTATTAVPETDHDAEEKTMLWRNIASLFTKYEDLESTVQHQHDSTKRRSDEIYSDLKGMWCEVEQIQNNVAENHTFSECVRKIRKYVNKKCETIKKDINYGSSCANDEIFAYIEKLREEFDTRIKNLQDENNRREQELSELNDTYDRDYHMFIQRENELMAKLDAALHMNDTLNERIKQFEGTMMRQFNDMRDQVFTMRKELTEELDQRDVRMVDDMREEFAHAITKEIQFENTVRTQVVQNVNDDIIDLITRSNEYHSYRYFATVEDIKQIRDNVNTVKKSIGMIDAELSDVKETVEQLTDELGQNTTDVSNVEQEVDNLKKDVYHELDRDYYYLKDYIKRINRRHERKYHPQDHDQITNAVQLIAEEYAEQEEEPQQPQQPAPEQPEPQQPQQQNEIFIIIDENTIVSEDDNDVVIPRPQV